MIFVAAFLLTSLQEGSADEIVVTAARRGRCDLSAAGHIIADPEFKARAAEWRAGRTVRVVMPARARVACLAKIMFRLADHGVTRAEFVDQLDPQP